ncbi:hypothetical protein HaLaN_32417, partial [Haematococcus lacustris]
MLPHQELDYPYGKEAMMVASDQQSEDLQRSLLEYN